MRVGVVPSLRLDARWLAQRQLHCPHGLAEQTRNDAIGHLKHPVRILPFRGLPQDGVQRDPRDHVLLFAGPDAALHHHQGAAAGFLARWNDKLKEYDWLANAVAGWLLNFATQ